MNTQLLRYNVLTEHLTFPPILPASRDFGRTGRTIGCKRRGCAAHSEGTTRTNGSALEGSTTHPPRA